MWKARYLLRGVIRAHELIHLIWFSHPRPVFDLVKARHQKVLCILKISKCSVTHLQHSHNSNVNSETWIVKASRKVPQRRVRLDCILSTLPVTSSDHTNFGKILLFSLILGFEGWNRDEGNKYTLYDFPNPNLDEKERFHQKWLDHVMWLEGLIICILTLPLKRQFYYVGHVMIAASSFLFCSPTLVNECDGSYLLYCVYFYATGYAESIIAFLFFWVATLLLDLDFAARLVFWALDCLLLLRLVRA